MSAAETKDAYYEITVPLPNGREMRAKPMKYGDAKKLLGMAEACELGQERMSAYLAEFHRLSGIAESAPELADLTPSEVYDASHRFFSSRRPARIEGQTSVPSTPAPVPA